MKNNKQQQTNEKDLKSNSRTWNVLGIAFLFVLFAVPFVYSPNLLGRELIPKFLFINALWLLPIGYLLFSKKQQPISFSLIDFVLLAFFVWQAISIAWSPDLGGAIYSSLNTFILFLSYYIALVFLRQDQGNERLLYFTAGFTALCLGLLGWYQFFGISDFSDRGMVYEVKGFAGQKNLFVLQLFLYLPLLLVGFVKLKNKVRYFLLGIALMNLLLCFTLLARAFLMGFLVSAFLAFVLYLLTRKQESTAVKWKPILLIALVIFGSLTAIFMTKGEVEFLKRYNIAKFSQTRNAKERIQLWDNTIQLIKDRPITGYGAASWPIYYPSKSIHKLKRLAEQNVTAARPHNDYLWIASENGLLGLGLYLGFLAMIYFYGIKALFKTKDLPTKRALIVLISLLTGYLIIAFFDFPRERAELNFLLAVLLAMLLYHSDQVLGIKKLWTTNKLGITLLNASFLGTLIFAICVGYFRYDGEYYVKKIITHYQKEQYDPMLPLAQKAKNPFFEIDPFQTPVDFYPCFVYQQKNNVEESIKYCTSAAQTSPYYLKANAALGRLHAAKKEFNISVIYFEQALQINPSAIKIREALSVSYYNAGEKEKAREVVKGIESEHPAIKQIQSGG